MKQKEPFSPERVLWKLICLILGLFLAGMLIVTAGFQYLLGQIRFTASADSPVPSSPAERLEQFLNPGDVNWQQLGADLTKQDHKTLNILLIGQDRREDETSARADSMILCTFRKATGELVMTSILRDLYLPIPGYGSDRINAAYAYGGASLLKQTITENFDIRIDGAIEVDFSQFSHVIDALGGVDVQLRQDEAEVINQETGSTLTEGSHLLTGPQALAYSRIRSLDSDGDFSRTDRQRKVMSAVIDTYRDAGLPVLIRSLKEVLPMISTDMTESRLLMLALEVFPMLPQLQLSSQSIPAPGSYSDETIRGMAVLVADMDASRQLLQKTAGSE